MANMIYEFKTHSIYYDSNYLYNTFSLTIDTLELFFELVTGKFIGIQGFFPLIQAKKCKLNLPQVERCKEYYLEDVSGYKLGIAYDLIVKIPQTRMYFENLVIKFDKEKGIIQVGSNPKHDDVIYKINENIILIFDFQNILKCIFIMPSFFLN